VNILFLDQFSDLGGAQQCLLDLLPAVRTRGWRAFCALPGNGQLMERLRSLGIPVFELELPRLASGRKGTGDVLSFARSLPRTASTILRLVRSNQIELLYVNGPRVLAAAAWTARRTRVPIVFHCHNELAQGAAARLAGRSIRFANAQVIACSRSVVRPLERYISPGHLHVIYNGARGPEQAITTPQARQAKFRIGVIGRISPEKGQAEFLHAAKLLHGRVTGCEFVVCGSPLFEDRQAQDYLELMRDLAAELPVEFLGWQQDIYSILAGLDMLVVPSIREPGAPRIILEAFAASVPVVAFPTGGITELITDGQTGFLVEPITPEALAGRIEELLKAPGQLKTVAVEAHRRWREEFTVDRYQREVLDAVGLTQTRLATGRPMRTRLPST
jgi:glycosyltransferase involved in cell wall biosynthesis